MFYSEYIRNLHKVNVGFPNYPNPKAIQHISSAMR
jgi:hypothetical protein